MERIIFSFLSILKKILPPTIKSSLKKKFYPPGVERPLWSNSEEFKDKWKARISTMASYIDSPGTVADFGCGMMWLEPMLKPGNAYLPVDYIARDSRTVVVNLNRDPLPALDADIAFLSGVLEYVQDVPGFCARLKHMKFRKIILSYCTTEKHGNREARKAANWVSHESIFSLLGYFCPDFTLTRIDDVNRNTILVFDRSEKISAIPEQAPRHASKGRT